MLIENVSVSYRLSNDQVTQITIDRLKQRAQFLVDMEMIALGNATFNAFIGVNRYVMYSTKYDLSTDTWYDYDSIFKIEKGTEIDFILNTIEVLENELLQKSPT